MDDDADTREALGHLLDAEGYRVAYARNGLEALKYLGRGERPSLILLDLMMPIMSGNDFLACRRRNPGIAAIPVVVLTASGKDKPGEANALLRKPLDLPSLFANVRHFCRGS